MQEEKSNKINSFYTFENFQKKYKPYRVNSKLPARSTETRITLNKNYIKTKLFEKTLYERLN